MFKTVSKAQISAVKFCRKNYTQYMEKDVEEISKAMNLDDKQAIAYQVKKALDEKYNWYNWVVLVYSTDRVGDHMFYNMKEVPAGKITVAVGYTQKTEEERKVQVLNQLNSCFSGMWRRYSVNHQLSERMGCVYIEEQVPKCSGEVAGVPVREFLKIMHTSYKEDFGKVPDALQTFDCKSGGFAYRFFVHYSQTLPVCNPDPCQNGGKCERLLDSNDWLCECPDGYYGDTCEKESTISVASETDLQHPVPDISTIDIKLDKMESKLKNMESKLEEVLNKLG